MSRVDGTKLSLKVMINEQKSKVLFAEANSFVADALLGFLTLPLAKILRILEKYDMLYVDNEPVIGCSTSVYLNKLNYNKYLSVSDDKQPVYMGSMSLGAEFYNLLYDFFQLADPICSGSNCPHSGDTKVNKVSEIGICVCGEPQRGRALTIKTATFVISDDLRVVPMRSGFLQTLSNLGISDIHGAQPISLSLGIHDVVNLLKLSLISSTPLTDLVFKNSRSNFIAAKSQPIHTGREHIIPAKMILKVSLQKSTNKFLFAEATEDFVEFLFSLLALPLAEAVRRLDGKIPFKNIGNLYMSVADFIDEEYFRDRDTKRSLLNPKIDRGYFSLKPIVDGNDKSNVFFVNDNLTVEHFSIATMVLKLNGLGISLSDMKETEILIGEKEALEILRASLVSRTALTDALITPMLSRLPNPSPKIVLPLSVRAQEFVSGTIH